MERQKPAKQRGGGLQKGSPSPPWWYVRGGGRLARGRCSAGPKFYSKILFRNIPVNSGFFPEFIPIIQVNFYWRGLGNMTAPFVFSPHFTTLLVFFIVVRKHYNKKSKKKSLL